MLPQKLSVMVWGGQSRVLQCVGVISSQKARISEFASPKDTRQFFCVSAGIGRLHELERRLEIPVSGV